MLTNDSQRSLSQSFTARLKMEDLNARHATLFIKAKVGSFSIWQVGHIKINIFTSSLG